MKSGRASDGETEASAPRSASEVGWRLYVVGGATQRTLSLPATGQVVLGRSTEADLQIDDPSISRRHAILRLDPPLRIEDLGGRNGTTVGGRKIAPGETCEVRVGETIELGSVVVVVQPGASPPPLRRVWTHEEFEARLEGECARAARDGRALAVVRLVSSDRTRDADLARLLVANVRTEDVVASFAPGEHELLLLDVAPAPAQEVVRKLAERLSVGGIRVQSRVASFPQDGRTAAQLIARSGVAPREEPELSKLVVQDPVMLQLHGLIERVAVGNISVLLLGETGVGKEVFAETVHRGSARNGRPFLRLNCGAFSESLLESELFGHERGAFTGAVAAKPGLLETAEGGTVFLDEVGELPPTTQVKLLRVIEERSVRRIGSIKSIEIDVRFVSATNRDLEADVAAGRFREDLFFRLNGFSVLIPPLRERVSEIEPLARALLAADARSVGRARVPELSPEALNALRAYSWPGNIRELRNVLQRAALLCGDEAIALAHLPVEKMNARVATLPPKDEPPIERRAALLGELEAVERQRILEALAAAGGNQSKAAKLLGISRNTLLNRLNRLDLPRPRKK
jgi:DNA-binding NtrC family response regulator